MNPPCNSPQYVDNFCYHVDCAVSDKFLPFVTCGPRWTNVSELGSDIFFGGTDVPDLGCVWPELILDIHGNVIGFQSPPQAFQWVDIWHANNIVTVCGASDA
jgi:hypothetical protein